MAIEPLNTGVGYVMADHVWTRTEDGWECDYYREGLPSTVFASAKECATAIADMDADNVGQIDTDVYLFHTDNHSHESHAA